MAFKQLYRGAWLTPFGWMLRSGTRARWYICVAHAYDGGVLRRPPTGPLLPARASSMHRAVGHPPGNEQSPLAAPPHKVSAHCWAAAQPQRLIAPCASLHTARCRRGARAGGVPDDAVRQRHGPASAATRGRSTRRWQAGTAGRRHRRCTVPDPAAAGRLCWRRRRRSRRRRGPQARRARPQVGRAQRVVRVRL